MSKLANVALSPFDAIYGSLGAKITEKASGAHSVEEAAQITASLLYQEFSESMVLSRIFFTVPFGKLPDYNRKFVQDLAVSSGVSNLLTEEKLVLSLLGSAGKASQWNDRTKSKGHVGIPLVSSVFIDAIPMMSRLLKSLGGSLSWIDQGDTQMVTRQVSNLSGVFYVPDAKTSVDQKGRKIIPAQDFVEQYNIKTVFGFGGRYLDNLFVVFINFTSEFIEQSIVESFLSLSVDFKKCTHKLVTEGKIFKES